MPNARIDEVHTEQRIDHHLDRERHELESLERLVRERVPADLSKGTEVLQDGDVGAEIEVGEKRRVRKGQRERDPAPHQLPVEPQPNASQTKHPDDDQRVDDGEREGRGVSPDVVAHARVPASAEQDEPALDRDLGDDRDRVELRAAHRIEGVAQEVRVSRRDEKGGARNDQRGQAGAQVQRNRHDDRRCHAQHDLD